MFENYLFANQNDSVVVDIVVVAAVDIVVVAAVDIVAAAAAAVDEVVVAADIVDIVALAGNKVVVVVVETELDEPFADIDNAHLAVEIVMLALHNSELDLKLHFCRYQN